MSFQLIFPVESCVGSCAARREEEWRTHDESQDDGSDDSDESDDSTTTTAATKKVQRLRGKFCTQAKGRSLVTRATLFPSIIPPFMNTEIRFVLRRLPSERLETNASNMSTRAEDRNGSAVCCSSQPQPQDDGMRPCGGSGQSYPALPHQHMHRLEESVAVSRAP